jgi:hypothetical protein
MISPDGRLGDIPAERVNEATAAGFKQAVVMTSPDGQLGYVPHDRANEAVKAGFKVGQPSAQAFADRGQNAEGFASAVGSDLAGMAKGAAPLLAGPAGVAYQAGKQAIGEAKSYVQTGKTVEENAADERAAAGHGKAYQTAAGVNEALGVNVKGMEQAADTGDVSGVLGHAAAVPVAAAITTGVAKAAPAGVSLAGKGARMIAEKSIEQTLRPMPKMFRFGKDPVGFVLDNKITANSLPELKANIDTALQAKNSELNGVLANAPKVDLQPAALDLQNAIRRAGTQRNLPVARQLSKLYNDMFVNKPMVVSAVDAAEIKRGIQDSINWESDGPGLSSAKKQLQHSVGEQIYKSAPNARGISEDISSGIEAGGFADPFGHRELLSP